MDEAFDAAPAGRGDFTERAATALIFAAAQFVALTVVAMVVYDGGSGHDASAPGYSLVHNFFSDLGMTVTYSGARNGFASVLFTYALAAVGVALACFGLAVRRLAGRSTGGRVAPALGAVAAAVSGAAYVGIAATPHDLAGGAHSRFVDLAFGFLLVFVVALLVVEVRAGWPRRWTVANAAYLGLLAVYVYILFWGPSTETTSGLVTQVGAQKVIVYSSIVNLGWQAVGLRRAARGSAGAAELTVHAAREGSYQAE